MELGMSIRSLALGALTVSGFLVGTTAQARAQASTTGQQYFDWFKFQFWCFVFVQQIMGKEIQTFLDYPPMQRGASFNLDAIKAEMAKRMAEAEAASKGPSN